MTPKQTAKLLETCSEALPNEMAAALCRLAGDLRSGNTGYRLDQVDALRRLSQLAEALSGSAEKRRAIAELRDRLTRTSPKGTQDLVEQKVADTKRAATARLRRREPVNSVALENRREKIVRTLSSDELSEASRNEILEELEDKSSGFAAADLVEIARQVTGRRFQSGKEAVRQLKSWTRRQINTREANDQWRDAAENKI